MNLHLMFVVSAVGWQVWQFDNYSANSECNAQRLHPGEYREFVAYRYLIDSGLLVHGLQLWVADRGSGRQLELHDPQQQQQL